MSAIRSRVTQLTEVNRAIQFSQWCQPSPQAAKSENDNGCKYAVKCAKSAMYWRRKGTPRTNVPSPTNETVGACSLAISVDERSPSPASRLLHPISCSVTWF